MQVCVPSTPAQMFHMLRRQMLQPFRKPLIVMTPKSLLRHELSVSALEDLTQRQLRARHRRDRRPARRSRCERVVFCSGKVYFDLLKARRKEQLRDVALVRIEQLYPFPSEEYQAVLGALRERHARSCGARRSRRTRAPGTRSATACRSWRRPTSGAATRAAPRPRPRRPASQDPRARAAGAGRGGAACRPTTEETARDTTRLTAPLAPATPLRKKLMSDRNPGPAAARVGRRRDAGGLAQAARRGRSAATRTSPISRPTRWCSKCRRRPTAWCASCRCRAAPS